MTAKDQLLSAIEQAPESLIQQVLDFFLFLQARQAVRAFPNAAEGQGRLPQEAAAVFEKIMEISDRASQLPVLDDRTPDQILGYNAAGLPDSYQS
ncbi:MAG: hypothetical protein VKK80_04465 [Prochlorothrix sp.]|nr:hypothetical protein [Prochlorothrix sp.]